MFLCEIAADYEPGDHASRLPSGYSLILCWETKYGIISLPC